MKTILIVDDSKSMRQMIEMSLKSAGFKTITAEDGADGLSKFNSNPIDLVITDVNMPNMNCIELTIKIRAINKSVPILVLTTESADETKQKGKTAGATGWIVKPFTPEKLIATINRVI